MAYYNYKVVRDMIPGDFEDRYVTEFDKVHGDNSYDSDANYDGHRWLLTAEYIAYLSSQLELGQSVSVEEWFKNGAINV